MPDQNGTEATRPDAPKADDALFGDAADKAAPAPTAVVEEQAANEETAQDTQNAADAEAETDAADELKVVVSIRGSRAVIGVQRPESDPHIETFADLDESGVIQEVPVVIERARARWEEFPKHPTYERPAPPARRGNRRQRGAAQDATAETQEAETQQQTLRLF